LAENNTAQQPTNENRWKEEIDRNVEYWSSNVHQPVRRHWKEPQRQEQQEQTTRVPFKLRQCHTAACQIISQRYIY